MRLNLKEANHGQKKTISCRIDGCTDKCYAMNLCVRHYKSMKRMGTIELRKVADLPGEKWRSIDRPGCSGLMISNLGRVKSCRKRDEKLRKSRIAILKKGKSQLLTMVVSNGGVNLFVHLEVLRAFHPNPDGDFRAIFLDGDRTNCRSDNLQWYGRGYLVEKAIRMAEESSHPLANEFKQFWLGDHNALNGWFEEQRGWLGSFMHSRFDRFNVPYYVDVSNCAQEALVIIFLSLRRGMLRELTVSNLRAWTKKIAKNCLAMGVRDLLPASSIYGHGYSGYDDYPEDDNTYSIIDEVGWSHPSAELEAIYNQEFA